MFQEYSDCSLSNVTQYINNLQVNKTGLWLIPWFFRNESVYLQEWFTFRPMESVQHLFIVDYLIKEDLYIENAATIQNQLFTAWKKSSL